MLPEAEAVGDHGVPGSVTSGVASSGRPGLTCAGLHGVSEHYSGYRSSGLKCCAIAGLTRPRRGALITLILIRCRLRVGDATRLSYDGLVTDPRGAPYLSTSITR